MHIFTAIVLSLDAGLEPDLTLVHRKLPWKKDNPHRRHLHDTVAIIMNVCGDPAKNELKTGSNLPPSGPQHGTTAWHKGRLIDNPIYNHLIAQSLGKKKGPHGRYQSDTPVIVPHFWDNHPQRS